MERLLGRLCVEAEKESGGRLLNLVFLGRRVYLCEEGRQCGEEAS